MWIVWDFRKWWFFFWNDILKTRSKQKSKKHWLCVFRHVLLYKKLRRTSETTLPDHHRIVAKCPIHICICMSCLGYILHAYVTFCRCSCITKCMIRYMRHLCGMYISCIIHVGIWITCVHIWVYGTLFSPSHFSFFFMWPPWFSIYVDAYFDAYVDIRVSCKKM